MKKKRIEEKIFVDILTGHQNLWKGFTKLKKEGTPDGIENIFFRLKNSSAKCGSEIKSYLYPEGYSQLFMRRIEYAHCSLEKEILWGKILLKSCADVLNKFLSYRRVLENDLLQGNYLQARNILEQIKKECGHSLWAMDQEFLLNELEEGLEANKKFQEQLNSQMCTKITRYFADFFSLKAEKNLNRSQYMIRVNKRLKYVSKESKAYYQMHLMVEINVADVDWSKVLYYAEGASIVDYYIDYCKVCSYILSDSQTSQKTKQYIKAHLYSLAEVISSPVLDKLSFMGNQFEFLKVEDDIYEIGVAYTEGRYEDVIDKCKKILERDATNFEVYEYYMKSCIISKNQEFVQIIRTSQELSEGEIPLKQMLLAVLYEVYRKEENMQDAFDKIFLLVRYLNGFLVAVEIYNFYLEKIAYRFSGFWRRSLAYQSQYHNIRHSFLYDGHNRAKYMECFEKKYGVTALSSLYQFMMEDVTQEELNKVEDHRMKWYKIQKLTEKKKYQEALSETVKFQLCDTPYVTEYLKEELPLFIIRNRLYLGKYKEALDLLINIFLENPYMVIQIDKKKLYKQITENLNDEIKESIAMPILSRIVNRDEVGTIFVDFANFMDGRGIGRVRDLFNMQDQFPKQSLIYFLKNICVPDVMDSMYWVFENEEEVLEERLIICQKLRCLDVENEKEYNEEIGLITQRQSLLNNIRYLDEQKIDFDLEKIHNSYRETFADNFKRYTEIGNIWQNIQGYILENTLYYTYILNDDKEEEVSKDRQNQKLRMFAELFTELRDEIAFGKMGLDQSLGTRIRHGKLQNQVRHVFESKNLIFLKKDDCSQEYIPIDERKYQNMFGTQNMSQKEKQMLQKIISEFTRSIDNIVMEINRDFIRIHTEFDYPMGVIDLEYSPQEVWKLFQIGANYESYEALMEFFEENILERIQLGLQRLRVHFGNDYKIRYIETINVLEEKLKEFYQATGQNENFSRVQTKLIQCRTDIQRELEEIAQWFQLPKTQEHPDYFMVELLETCKAAMRNINSRFNQANIHITDSTELKLKGKTFSYCYEILLILFNNAFCHAGYTQSPEKLEIELSIFMDGKMLHIEMYTNLSELIDIEKVKTRVYEVKRELNSNSNRFYSKDTGSGYIKIKNMLQMYIAPHCWWALDFGLEEDENLFFTRICIDKDSIIGGDQENEAATD